jgi:molybdate transport system substrate-binding protein
MRAQCCAVIALVGLLATPDAAAETVLRHAAGSLRGAFTEIIAGYAAATGDTVQPKFGASGLLKDEIASGCEGGGVRLRKHGTSAGVGAGRTSWAGRIVCA